MLTESQKLIKIKICKFQFMFYSEDRKLSDDAEGVSASQNLRVCKWRNQTNRRQKVLTSSDR